jgi:endonuclease/exonuclease/phosphatase (EEP) superfamily protein YafD
MMKIYISPSLYLYLLLILVLSLQRVWFVTTHIATWDNTTEVIQLVQFLQQLLLFDSQSVQSLVLMGDFNQTPNTANIHYLHHFMRDAWLECGRGNGFTWRRYICDGDVIING